MSIVPEYIIQQMLVRGLRAFREDGRLVDALFRNLQQDDLSGLRTFFRENSIDIALNYPDSDLKLPAIVVLLKTEAESDAFLGNLLQPSESVDNMGMPFQSGDGNGAGSTSRVTTVGVRILADSMVATGGSQNTITVPGDQLYLFDPFEEDAFVRILSGIGEGQERQILSVSPVTAADTIITVVPNWNTIPDDTSDIQIHAQPSADGTGEPSKIFQSTDIVSRIGAHYQVTYQLLILGSKPEIVIYLYNIVRAIVFLNMDFLIQQGFLNVKMSGSDFLPRADYLPDLAYQRTLNLDFGYSFDVYAASSDTLFDKLRVSLTVSDPDVSIPSGQGGVAERVVLETELDL